MSIEKAKELCRKYAKSTQYYDEFIENDFVDMPPLVKEFVNQISSKILKELEMAQERKISTNLDLTIEEAVKEYKELQVYLKSEAWVNSVIEKIERRMADLSKLVIEKI